MSETIVDNQILVDHVCPAYGHIRHDLGYISRSVGVALGFGTAVHSGLHKYHDTRNLVAGGIAFEEVFSDKPSDDMRTFEKGVEILEEYHARFGTESWRDLVEGGEVKATLPISDNPPVLYVVRIDRPGWLDGELWFKEWKTSSRPTGFITKPNQQITGYTWAMRTLFDQPVVGALVELLGVFKSSKNGKRQVGTGTSKTTISIIERVPVAIADWEVHEWAEGVVHKVEEILRYRAQKFWPKKTTLCGMWNGCPYIPLCTTPINQWDMVLESGYEEKPWNPGGED